MGLFRPRASVKANAAAAIFIMCKMLTKELINISSWSENGPLLTRAMLSATPPDTVTKAYEEIPLSEPPQDPIALLIGLSHRDITGGGGCAGSHSEQLKFERTGDRMALQNRNTSSARENRSQR